MTTRSRETGSPRHLRGWWRGVLAYVVAAATWIVVSDLLLVGGAEDPHWVSIAKGLAFVAVTGALLAAVLARSHRRLHAAAEAISERDRQLELLAEHADDILFRVELEPAPRFGFVSGSVERITGYTPDEHYADPSLVMGVIHPDDRHLLDDLAALDGVQRMRWRRRDGRTIWVEQRNHVEVADDGRPLAIVGVTREVTAEAIEAAVRDAIGRFDGAVLADGDVDSALELLAEELASCTEAVRVEVHIEPDAGHLFAHDVVVGRHAADPEGAVTRSASDGTSTVRMVLSAASPDPVHVAPLLPRLAARIEATHDAADRSRRVRRLEQALRSTASAVLLTDRDGTIEWVNPAFTRVTGYELEQAVGRTPRLLKSGHHPPSFYERLWATITAGQPFADTLIDRRKDGATYVAAVTIDPVFDDAGRIEGFVGIQKDVTAEQQERERLHERELETLRRERDLELDRTLLVQTISHELRTPLTVITGVADTLHRDDVPPADRQRLLDSLRRSSELLLNRFDVILAATDGVVGPTVETTGRAVVDGALRRLGGQHDLARLELVGDAPWRGHQVLAQAMLRPVIENALGFSPSDATVRVVLSRSEAGLRIAVHDRGPGIDLDFLDRTDQPFQQADPSATRHHGGMGLGLYAARRAASRLGATLEFAAGPDGTGTTVVMDLPTESVVTERVPG